MPIFDGKEPEADAIALGMFIDSLRACSDPTKRRAADVIERLRGVISETVNQRDAALALLREAQEVLADHWFTSVMDGDYGEDFNNEDVIAMDDKIKKFLPEAPK